MTDRYILVDGEPVQEPDLFKWARWYEEGSNRRIAWTEIGDMKVSTIFTGVDVNLGLTCELGERPILFETMVFGGERNGYRESYCTLEEAMIGHEKIVAMVDQDFPNPPPHDPDAFGGLIPRGPRPDFDNLPPPMIVRIYLPGGKCPHNHLTLHLRFFVRCELCGRWRLRNRKDAFRKFTMRKPTAEDLQVVKEWLHSRRREEGKK